MFASETPVPVVVTDVAPSDEVTGADATAKPKRKRKLRWLWWTLAGLAAASLIALSVYLIMVTNGWRNYSAELEAALADVTLSDDALASAWYRGKTLPVLVRRALTALEEAA